MLESPQNRLYLLGNVQSGKSEKSLSSLEVVPDWKRTPCNSPLTYLRNIQTGKCKKLFLSVGEVRRWERNTNRSPLFI